MVIVLPARWKGLGQPRASQSLLLGGVPGELRTRHTGCRGQSGAVRDNSQPLFFLMWLPLAFQILLGIVFPWPPGVGTLCHLQPYERLAATALAGLQ